MREGQRRDKPADAGKNQAIPKAPYIQLMSSLSEEERFNSSEKISSFGQLKPTGAPRLLSSVSMFVLTTEVQTLQVWVGNEARPMAAGLIAKIKHVHADWRIKALLLDKP